MNELKIEKPKELINLTDRKINRHKQSDKESENTFNCFLFLTKWNQSATNKTIPPPPPRPPPQKKKIKQNKTKKTSE